MAMGMDIKPHINVLHVGGKQEAVDDYGEWKWNASLEHSIHTQYLMCCVKFPLSFKLNT